jgi:hypothetical protein
VIECSSINSLCKSLFLGIGYGMQAPSLSAKAGSFRQRYGMRP